jgi:hypothetical protein
MASPFAFVPRKVAKSTKTHTPVSNASPTWSAIVQGSSAVGPVTLHKSLEQSPLTTNAKDSSKGKDKAVAPSGKSLPSDDYLILICLALSDHALWSDPNLRRAIEQHHERCTYISNIFFSQRETDLSCTLSPSS